MDGKLVAYYRVSTVKQGNSGLGLEAQTATVQDHAARAKASVIASYTEVESGKRSDRPQLALALAHARRAGATLVVAKLDRLSRNVVFLGTLLESKVPFVACDNPHASPFTIHILAAVAEYEATATSQRTKAALKAAKARGVVLGTPGNLTYSAQRKGAARNKEQATRAYLLLVPAIRQWRSEGQTYREIASRLNSEGQSTRNGAAWTAMQVFRVLDRLKTCDV